MKFDIVTIFPKMVRGPLEEGIVARAIANGLLDVAVHDLRDFTTDRHRVVDDVPFGGGPGMVLKPEPLFRAVDAIRERAGEPDAIVLTSPDGALARLAAANLAGSANVPVMVLAGGTEAWAGAGLPLETGATRMASDPDDVVLSARERGQGREEAMREYLAWEIDLVNQMATDDDQRFRVVTV